MRELSRWLQPFFRIENLPAGLALVTALVGSVLLSTGVRGTGFGVCAVAWGLVLLAMALVAQRSGILTNIESRLSRPTEGWLQRRAEYFDPVEELRGAQRDGRTETWVCAPTARTWVQDYIDDWEKLQRKCRLTFIIMNPNAPAVESTCAYFNVTHDTLVADIRSTLEHLSPFVKASRKSKRCKVTVCLMDEMPLMGIRYFRGGSKPDACSIELYPYRSRPPNRPGRHLDPEVEADWLKVFRTHLQKLSARCEHWDGDVERLFLTTQLATVSGNGKSRAAASKRYLD
jgi:hypothetical protein